MAQTKRFDGIGPIPVVADADYSAGGLALIGGLFGIWDAAVASGDSGPFNVSGVHDLPQSATAKAVGDLLCFDASTGKVTGTANGLAVARCVKASADSDTTVRAIIVNAAAQRVYRGSLTFGASDTSKTATVPAFFNGKTVFISFNDLDSGSATKFTGAVASGTLTLTADAAPGSSKNAVVNYLIVE